MGGDAPIPAWHHLPDNPYNPHAWILGNPEIGPGCWIGAFTVLDASGGLVIGTGCDISAGAQIYSHSTVRRAVSARAVDIERAPTRIGNHVHIGAGAVVLMGASIDDHCVVAAGAIVPQYAEVPPWSAVMGVPGRIVTDGARRYGQPPAPGSKDGRA